MGGKRAGEGYDACARSRPFFCSDDAAAAFSWAILVPIGASVIKIEIKHPDLIDEGGGSHDRRR